MPLLLSTQHPFNLPKVLQLQALHPCPPHMSTHEQRILIMAGV